MEEILQQALRTHFRLTMATDYLNCGYDHIDSGAEKISIDKGYKIEQREGIRLGQKWGYEGW